MFNGIRVLDLTKVFSGPLATRYLADYGAEVIKIENADNPDPTRFFPPIVNNWSGYFELLNRNKKSLLLNLKLKSDLNNFYKLVKTADVVVENLAPSTKRHLNIDYQKLKRINPKIIYASLAGLDQNTDIKYFDIIAQAESGLMTLSGHDSQPLKIGPAIVDAYSGMSLAFAISTALYFRQKTGLGQSLNVSMLASTLDLLEQSLIEYSVSRKLPKKPGSQDNAIAPFGIFRSKSGFLVLAIGTQNQWNNFISLFPNSSLSDSKFSSNTSRLKHLPALVQEITKEFSKHSLSHLIKRLSSNGIPVSRINSMSEVSSNTWYFSQGYLKRFKTTAGQPYITPGRIIKFSRQKNTQFRSSPALGVNTTDFTLHN